MDHKKRPGLKGLLAKNKGGSSKEAPKTQPQKFPFLHLLLTLACKPCPTLRRGGQIRVWRRAR